MDECEICGRKSDVLYLVDIDGTQLSVCRKCSSGKEVLQTFGKQAEAARQVYARAPDLSSEEIIDDYGKAIRHARESLGLPAKVLAERINEKESTLVRIEAEHALPDDRLARKLERALGIRLIATKEGAEHHHAQQQRHGEVTLGDAAIIKKPKEGE